MFVRVGSDKMLIVSDALRSGCSSVGSDGMFLDRMLQEPDVPKMAAKLLEAETR